jgi:hypothetical protein
MLNIKILIIKYDKILTNCVPPIHAVVFEYKHIICSPGIWDVNEIFPS